MKKSHESAEDYLETILILREKNGNVRSIDIVNKMNYSKPSISIEMKKLKSEDLVFPAQTFGEVPDRDRCGS